jgi:hypothetical protein
VDIVEGKTMLVLEATLGNQGLLKIWKLRILQVIIRVHHPRFAEGCFCESAKDDFVNRSI